MPPQRLRIDELQSSLWKENKTTLRRLYLEERRTLKDVKKAMESEYGFPVAPHTAIYFNGTQIPWNKAWKEIRRSGARESIDCHATELPVDVVMRSPSPVLGVRSATSLRYMMPVPWRLSDASLEALIPAAVDCRTKLYNIPSNLFRMAMINNSQHFLQKPVLRLA
ncbi:hypothetical protein E0Z10_g7649 [Xylaria hypoxylon]|uniref:Clr5 domain-containing protein n=1 Tax=Xylaria hypoxylon TaxID=37992 RepID=A0A4Z0YPK8_9PEZI|nr:hypothetical protein E0Z10_g7649 [Xylaria hypoxylon]